MTTHLSERAPGTTTITVDSHSEDETRAFGARLGSCLEGGELIGLRGDLGAGKTCLVRGVAEALGVPPHKVRSPSFTLIAEYAGGRLPVYHVDLYRLSPSDVDRLALREYLYGDGVCLVEWFERLGEFAEHLEIGCTFVAETERLFVFTAHGARYDTLLNKLRERWH
jgi:tRNA threonylcarbamoyladenosine biosynthesis protein TsaE